MKKLLLKTASITFGACLLLAALVLLIVSFAAPAAMMEFTASLGMETVSGNFAWKEYERSGDIDCLARSFLIAAEHGDDATALSRFEAFYADEAFESYCSEQTVTEGAQLYAFRDYVLGTAAQVKYRLAATQEERTAAVTFAAEQTSTSFPAGNPLFLLSLEAAERGDKDTCSYILSLLEGGDFSHSADYTHLINILEAVHE